MQQTGIYHWFSYRKSSEFLAKLNKLLENRTSQDRNWRTFQGVRKWTKPLKSQVQHMNFSISYPDNGD